MRRSWMWSHLRCRDVLGPAWRMQTACQCRPRRQAPWGPGRWVTISCDGRQCSMSAVPEPSPLAPRVSPALEGWRCRRHRAYDWRTRRSLWCRYFTAERKDGADILQLLTKCSVLVFFMHSHIISHWVTVICKINIYPPTFNMSRALVGNRIADHSDVVGASPVGAAPTTSSFPT